MKHEEPRWLIAGLVDELSCQERSLVLGTLDACCQAELPDVVNALVDRVIGPIPEGPEGDAREARLIDPTHHLRPFVLLALLDIRWAAQAPGWAPTMRRDRALEAIALAGF